MPSATRECPSCGTACPTEGNSSCPHCGSALDVTLTHVQRTEAFVPHQAPATPPPDAPPGYEVLEMLGRGGMGVVFKARQVQLKRLVALKRIRTERTDEAERARFRSEAEAVARLQHPNIVQVYEVGEHRGELFCVLEYMAGGSLDRRLRGTPLPPRSAARLVELLARAMHQAHELNLVHRDLKPANILLQDAAAPPEAWVPKVGDFGLAKLLDTDAPGLTTPDAILGTPSYMAPEQALGHTAAVARAADVYALGAILYECLTGRPPFRAASTLETLEQVRTQEPVPVRQLQPKVPRDLENICLQCLRKEPRRRYPTALELADDLHRFQAGEPVRARPVGAAERAWKWVRRRPAVAALLAVLALVVLGFSGIVYQRSRELEEKNSGLDEANKNLGLANAGLQEQTQRAQEAEGNAKKEAEAAKQAEQKAQRQADIARRGEFAAQLAHASVLAGTKPLEAVALLEDPKACPLELRDFTWELLYTACKRNRYTVCVASGKDTIRVGAPPTSLAPGEQTEVSFADAATLVGLCRLGDVLRVRRFAAADGTFLSDVEVPAWATVAADRRLAAWLTPEGRLHRYDLAAGRDGSWPLREHAAAVVSHGFSEDLRTLATVDEKGTLYLWETATGRLHWRSEVAVGRVSRFTFTPSGDRLVTMEQAPVGAVGQVARVWDTRSGESLRTLEKPLDGIERLVVSPDGRLAATLGQGQLLLHDLTTGKRQSLAGIRRDLQVVQFTMDGRRLVVLTHHDGGLISGNASRHSTLWIWDVAGTEPRSLQQFSCYDGIGLLSADRSRLVLGTYEGLNVFDTETGKAWPRPGGVFSNQQPLALTPDGRTLITKELRLWDLAGGQELMALRGSGPVAFSPDGRFLAARAAEGSRCFTVWDVAPEAPFARALPWDQPVSYVSVSADGGTVAAVGSKGGGFEGRNTHYRLFDAVTGEERSWLPGQRLEDQSLLAFTPDGHSLVADHGPELLVYDTTGRQRSRVPIHRAPSGGPMFASPPNLIALVPGKHQVAVSQGGVVDIKDLYNGQSVAQLAVEGQVTSAPAVSGDGARVAAGTQDGRVWLWDRLSGERRAGPGRHQGSVVAVALRPGDGRVASAGREGTVVLWNPADDSRIVLRGHVGPVTGLAFDPSGRTLVSAGTDRTVRFWDPETGQARATLQRHASPISCLAFSPDGSAFFTGTVGGELLAWRAGVRGESANLAGPDRVAGLALSPDGKTLFGGTMAGSLSEWDLASGQQREPPLLPYQAQPPARFERYRTVDLAVAADGRPQLTITTGDPQTGFQVRRWRERQGGDQEVALPSPRPGAGIELAYAADARTAAIALNPSRADGFNVLTQKYLDPAAGTEKVLFERRERMAEAFSPDGKYLVVSRQAHPFEVLDAASGALLWEGDGFVQPGFSPDGRWLAWTPFNTQEVRLCETATGKQVTTWKPTQGTPSLPVYSADGKHCAFQEISPVLRVVALETGKTVATIPLQQLFSALALSRDGKNLFGLTLAGSGAPPVSLVVWSLEGSREVQRWPVPEGHGLVALPDGKTVTVFGRGWLHNLDWSTGEQKSSATGAAFALPPLVAQDGNSLVIPTADGTCDLWDLTTLKLRTTLHRGRGPIVSCELAADGKTFEVREGEGTRLYNLATGEERFVPGKPLPRGALPVMPAPDGRGLYRADTRFELPPPEIQVRAGLDKEPRARFLGHTAIVRVLRLTHDARLAASAGEDRIVRVWDTTTGAEQAALSGHTGPVSVLAFSPGEDLLASAGEDGTVRLWDLRQKKEVALLRGPTEATGVLAFSADGTLLAAGGEDLVVRVWEVPAGRLRAAFLGHQARINEVLFTGDSQRLLSASEDGTIKVWDCWPQVAPQAAPAAEPGGRLPCPIALTADGRTLFRGLASGRVEKVDLASGARQMLDGKHDGPVLVLVLGADGNQLASGDGAGVVKVWDVNQHRERLSWPTPDGPISALAFTPDGQALASGAGRPWEMFARLRPSPVRLWEASTGRQTGILNGQEGAVYSLTFSPDGQTLAATSGDDTVRVWDWAAGVCRHSQRLEGPGSAAFMPDGTHLVICGLHRRGNGPLMVVWEPTGDVKQFQGNLHRSSPLRTLALSADGKTLAAAYADGMVGLWDGVSQRALSTLAVQADGDCRLTLSADGTTLATSGEGGAVQLWDVRGLGSRPLLAQPTAGEITTVAVCRSGERLVAVHRDRSGTELKVLEAADGRERGSVRIEGPEKQAESRPWTQLAVSADGRRAATVSMPPEPQGFPRPAPAAPPDGVIRLWDLEAGKEMGSLTGHTGRVLALVFSPDGKTVASAGDDKFVRLWDVEKRELCGKLAGHTQGVQRLAFRPDGRLLASADTDWFVKLWVLASGKEGTSVHLSGTYPLAPFLAFSPDGKELVTNVSPPPVYPPPPPNVQVWSVEGPDGGDTVTVRELRKLPGVPFGALALAQDGRALLVMGPRGVELREAADGRLLAVLAGRAELARPDSVLLAAPVQVAGPLESWSPLLDLVDPQHYNSHFGNWQAGKVRLPIVAAAYSADLKTVLMAGRASEEDDRKWAVTLWEAVGLGQPEKLLHVLDTLAGPIRRLALSPDGKAVVGGEDGKVRIYDTATGEALQVLAGPALPVACLSVSADGKRVAAAYGKEVRVWTIGFADEPLALRGAGVDIASLQLAPNGERVAAGDADGTVHVWDADGKAVGDWKGHAGAVQVVVFSPDGKLLASGGANGTVRMWEAATGKPQRKPPVQPDGVKLLAFSPDGKRLNILTASHTQLVELGTGRVELDENAYEPLQAIGYSADGKRFYKVWPMVWNRIQGNVDLQELGKLGRPRQVIPTAE